MVEIIFTQLAVALAGITYGTWKVRLLFQRRADYKRRSYELSFPNTMAPEQVLAFNRSLSGLPGPKFLKPVHSVVFETYAKGKDIRWMMHIPGHVKDKTEIRLESHIDGVIPSDLKDDPVATTIWKGIEILLKGVNQLSVDKVVELSKDVLAGFRGLNDDDSVVMQWTVWPAHRSVTLEDKAKSSDKLFNASLRIGANGERPERLLDDLYAALRRASAAGAHFVRLPLVNAGSKISQRSGMPFYQVLINALEFTALMGWPLDGSAGKGQPRTLPPSPMHEPSGIVAGIADSVKGRGTTITLPVDSPGNELNCHVRIIGQSGTGKSNFLQTAALQWIAKPDTAVILLAPESSLPYSILKRIPYERIADVIYFDPMDMEYPIGLNPFAGNDPERITSHIVSVFKNLSGDSWSPHLQRVMTTTVRTTALLGLTLYDCKQLLVSRDYRLAQLKRLKRAKHPEIFQEWEEFIDRKGDGTVDSAVTRLDSFLATPMIRNIVSQTKSLNFDRIIAEHQILLCPLPPARMGEGNASALGQLIREMTQNAAMRQESDNYQRSVTIMDEAQNYADQSTSKSDPYAEMRKFRQHYYLAHQFSNQLPKGLQDTVDNNVATQIAFRVDFKDAKLIAPRFKPMTDEDIEKIPKYHAVGRINTKQGIAPPVTFLTPPPTPETGYADWIIQNTRARWATPLAEVEADILTRHKAKDERKKPGIVSLGDD